MTHPRPFTINPRRSTDHLAPTVSREPMPPTPEQIRQGQVRKRIEAAHEIQALGNDLAEVWDELR